MATTPQADHLRRLGARFAPCRGGEAAADYGSPAEEYAALVDACGLVDRSPVSRLEMSGEDRQRFLNGLVTCDIKALQPGRGAYGFVTSVKGRVLADLTLLALEDRLWLELPPGTGEEIAGHLSKYAIVDRVEIKPLDDEVPLMLLGPRAEEVLADAADLPQSPFEHRRTSVLGSEVWLVRGPAPGVSPDASAWTLWVSAAGAESLFSAILERGGALGVRPVGFWAFERLRVEAGRPLFGVDFSADHFPQETGLEEEGVSYTKGCFLGQEVVARIHYRGRVNRHLRGLVFSGDTAADELVERRLMADGREAGTVTSAVDSGDRRIGLAILHQRAEPGADVEVEGGSSAQVVELPFD